MIVRPIASAPAAALALLIGCRDRSPPAPPAGQAAGPAGLVAFLDVRPRSGPPFAGCLPTPDRFDRLVTPAYRGVRAGELGGFEAGWRGDGPVTARVLYADDPAVPASLRRSRPSLPVGRPPLVAFIGDQALPALFVFDHGRWVCLVDLDGHVVSRLPTAACRAAYQHSGAGRCLDLTAPIATAALAGDGDALSRRCELLVRHGCGSVAADAPTALPP